MAREEPDDIERLLAEVDQSLSGGTKVPARKQGSSPTRDGDGVSALVPAVVSGVVAAVVVWVLFLFVPLLGEWSGAAGAFLGAAGTALVLQLLRRR
jgi:hypothetical protein